MQIKIKVESRISTQINNQFSESELTIDTVIDLPGITGEMKMSSEINKCLQEVSNYHLKMIGDKSSQNED